MVSAVQWFHLLAVQWFQCLLQQTDKMLTNALIIVALFLFDSKTFAQMVSNFVSFHFLSSIFSNFYLPYLYRSKFLSNDVGYVIKS